MANFNLQDYDTVHNRLKRFWEDHPAGAIITDMVSVTPDHKSVIIRAQAWFDKADPMPTGVGLAQENQGGNGPNGASWIENCFAPETEILTTSGWQRIDAFVLQRRKADLVGVIDGNGKLAFQKPEAFIAGQTSRFITIEDNCTRQRVTPDHRVMIGLDFIPAADLYAREKSGIRWWHIAKDIPHQFRSVRNRSNLADSSTDYARLLQWVIADGCLLDAGYIRFGFFKQRKVDRLEELLKRMGYEYKKTLNSRGVTSILVPGCKDIAHDLPRKTLTFWAVLAMSNEQGVAFIEEAAFTDGTNSRGGIYIRTIDREYIENICLLAAMNGFDCASPTFDEPPGVGSFANGKPVHRVRIKRGIRRQYRTYTVEDFDEPQETFCLTMPAGNLITRNEGKITVSGNCDTSAVGRALANCGYSGNLRSSREEMQKASRASVTTSSARFTDSGQTNSRVADAPRQAATIDRDDAPSYGGR